MKQNIISIIKENYHFSRKIAKKIYDEALDIAKKVTENPKEKDVLLILPDILYKYIFNKSFQSINTENLENQKVFYLSDDDKNAPKHFWAKFISENETVLQSEEFGAIALNILKHAVDSKISSDFNLLISEKDGKLCWDIIDNVADEKDCIIILKDVKTLQSYPENNSFMTKVVGYPKSYYGAGMTVALKKDVDYAIAEEAVKKVCQHIINKNPLCISLNDMLPSILEDHKKKAYNFAKKKVKKETLIDKYVNKKCNDFIHSAVLMEQDLTSDPEYYQGRCDGFKDDPEKQRITVKEYLDLKGISSLISFERI